MGHYTSVRGWLELNEEMVAQVRTLISETEQKISVSGTPQDIVKFYNRGWVFPKDHINWTHYIFYGADIRTEHLSFLKEQLTAIAEKVRTYDKALSDNLQKAELIKKEIVDFPIGLFFIDDEDRALSLRWDLKGGHLQESPQ